MLIETEKFLSAIDRDYHRNPQLSNMWRIRDHGILNTKWDIYIILLLPRLRNNYRIDVRKNVRARGSG